MSSPTQTRHSKIDETWRHTLMRAWENQKVISVQEQALRKGILRQMRSEED